MMLWRTWLPAYSIIIWSNSQWGRLRFPTSGWKTTHRQQGLNLNSGIILEDNNYS